MTGSFPSAPSVDHGDTLLAELLLLLHTSGDRWSALTATVAEWEDRDGIEAAQTRVSEAFFGGLPLSPPGAPRRRQRPSVQETTHRVTATAAGAVRRESEDERGPGLVVVAPDGGVLAVSPNGLQQREANLARAVSHLWLGLVGRMLAPAPLTASFRLAVTGAAAVAGRECLLATGQHRGGLLAGSHTPLGQGIEEVGLAVDRATGLVLRLECSAGGQVVHRAEAGDLSFGPPPDPGLFSLDLPEDLPVPPSTFHTGLTLADAAALVPFTVFGPEPTPRTHNWTATVIDRPGEPQKVCLMQFGTPARVGRRRMTQILQAADPAAMPDVGEWQPASDPAGQSQAGHTWSAGAQGPVHLVVRREATGIWISDADDLQTAWGIVAALRPVKPAPAQRPR